MVMFSGHGTMIDDQFYLVPYGADDSTSAHLKASAIPATEFKSEIEKLAGHGRVLVLLDACRSAGLMAAPRIAADRRHAEVIHERQQCDGADIIHGRQGLARG